jgi:hypothetical protein
MNGSYYFSQGRIISTYPSRKYADKNDDTIILIDKDNKNDIKNDIKNDNKDKENKDKNDWMKIFNGYKFQIFSPSILRYK